MFSGSTHVFRSVSPAFHLLRNHQRSGVWKLHQGSFTTASVSRLIWVICNSLKTNKRQETFDHIHVILHQKDPCVSTKKKEKKKEADFVPLFFWMNFSSASTRDHRKRASSGKPENNICQTAKTGKGNRHYELNINIQRCSESWALFSPFSKIFSEIFPLLLAPPVPLHPFTKTDVVQWRNPP